MAKAKRNPVVVNVGDVFKNYTVVRESYPDRYGRKQFEVRCTCGSKAVLERLSLVKRCVDRCRDCPKARKEA